jgi:hypothetical protein
MNEYSREEVGAYWALKRHAAQSQGDHLDRVQSDQKVLEIIRRGKLVLVIRGQESQNHSKRAIRLQSTQIEWFS